MPFLGSIFKCNNTNNEDNDSNMDLIKQVEEGRMERLFMKQQLEEVKENIDKISAKALTIFGLDKDIALIKQDLNYIKRDIDDFKQQFNDIKYILQKRK